MRGFAVLCMIGVHAKMLFLRRPDQHGAFGHTLELLGGAPAAPTFLFLMGLVWGLRPGQAWSKVGRRALEIFALGYLLNFLRLTVPEALGGPFPPAHWTETLFMIDILQMAAPTMLILRAVESWPSTLLAGVAGLIAVISAFTMGLTPSPGVFDILWGSGPFVFFPLLPWIVFPLAALAFRPFVTGQRLLGGTVFLIVGILLSRQGFPGNFTYYHPHPGQVFWMLGFVLLWRELARLLSPRLPAGASVAFRYLSENVTSYYVFSWLILSWSTFALGYKQLTPLELTALIPTAVLLSTLAVIFWQRRPRRSRKEKSPATL